MPTMQYHIRFSGLDGSRRLRVHEYFSGFKPVVSFGGFQIHLSRISTPYIFNYYLPSGLFVSASWMSYAISVTAVPGRVTLIMTTFLSLVNIANSAFATSPQNQGINLMQVKGDK